ncbi:transcriptional regulator [Pseudooceanicola sp. GBMRC 2024]|uniref:Transcriptional regulator n=1 Tax=Pseudooceanicola albus TaxID=2692189 RepID=A0A6L7G2M9_9RHOB|nr:helix-turn-helix domain-containing protein [Pseudooceanicola albus]MXN17768.1 transcriptional regulator [Pseudooceanicola albus]
MDRSDTECGLEGALKVVGGKWKPLILYHVQAGPTRFSEIRRRVEGISEKVLIQQLRDLVAWQVLLRRDHGQVPPVVDYALTPFGRTLVEALVPLCDWGNANRERITAKLAAPPQEEDRPRGRVPR